jgi:hypothetical protein
MLHKKINVRHFPFLRKIFFQSKTIGKKYKDNLMDLRTYLWKNNLKLVDFAEKIGCSRPYISLVCNNKKIPSRKLAEKIEELTHGHVKAQIFRKKKRLKKILSI